MLPSPDLDQYQDLDPDLEQDLAQAPDADADPDQDQALDQDPDLVQDKDRAPALDQNIDIDQDLDVYLWLFFIIFLTQPKTST